MDGFDTGRNQTPKTETTDADKMAGATTVEPITYVPIPVPTQTPPVQAEVSDNSGTELAAQPSYAEDPVSYRLDESQPVDPLNSLEISWTASEFIAHHKTVSWYAGLLVIALLVTTVGYLITREKITVAVIAFCALLFGFTASRQPRQLQYALNNDGLQAGRRFYRYGDFQSFSVIDEGPFSSLNFMPLKRFAPVLSVYYDPGHEQEIVQLLSQHLPLDNHTVGLIERLMRRIRF